MSQVVVAKDDYKTAFSWTVTIISALIWVILGVVYFIYHPPLIWLWRLLPIAMGLGIFASESEEEEGWSLFLAFVLETSTFVVVSALFFLYDPTEIWYWVRQQEVAKWLLAGRWY